MHFTIINIQCFNLCAQNRFVPLKLHLILFYFIFFFSVSTAWSTQIAMTSSPFVVSLYLYISLRSERTFRMRTRRKKNAHEINELSATLDVAYMVLSVISAICLKKHKSFVEFQMVCRMALTCYPLSLLFCFSSFEIYCMRPASEYQRFWILLISIVKVEYLIDWRWVQYHHQTQHT